MDIKPNFNALNSENFAIKITYYRGWTALIIQRLNRVIGRGVPSITQQIISMMFIEE